MARPWHGVEKRPRSLPLYNPGFSRSLFFPGVGGKDRYERLSLWPFLWGLCADTELPSHKLYQQKVRQFPFRSPSTLPPMAGVRTHGASGGTADSSRWEAGRSLWQKPATAEPACYHWFPPRLSGFGVSRASGAQIWGPVLFLHSPRVIPTSLRFVGGVEDEEAVQEGKAPLGCSSPRGFQECFTCHAPSRRARLLPSHLDPLVVGGPHLWSRCGRGPLTRRGWFQNSCE